MEEPELEEDGGGVENRAERGFPDSRKEWDWKGIKGVGHRQGEGEGASGQRQRRGKRAGSEGGAGVGQDRESARGGGGICISGLLTEWAGVA